MGYTKENAGCGHKVSADIVILTIRKRTLSFRFIRCTYVSVTESNCLKTHS